MTARLPAYDQMSAIYQSALLAGNLEPDDPWQTGLLAVYQAGYDAAVNGEARA